jgi:hypothetical protein
MILEFDATDMRGTVRNRHGEAIGIFVQRSGGWEFLPDEYRRDRVLTVAELQWVEKKQAELNI